jgi:hypothetical protein
MATSENFVTKNGDTVIFSLSQNELEMGRFRLCKTPYGLNFGQDDAATMPARTPEFEACKRLNQQIARDSQPKFESVTVDSSSANNTPAEVEDFSTISTAPEPTENTEIQGSAAAPQAPSSGEEVKVTLESRVVRDEVHSFFSGSHLTPRCWYRFDRKSSTISPDFLTSDGRKRTMLDSKRLTRYSISSASIVKSILADDKLRNMQFNVRSAEVLQAIDYNKNLQSVQSNQLYSWFIGFAGAGALKLTADQLASVGSLLRSGSSTAHLEIGKILADVSVRFRQGNATSTWAAEALQKMIGSKTAFIKNISTELKDLTETNKAMFGDWIPGKGIADDISADVKHRMWRANFLHKTMKSEEQFLEVLKKRAASTLSSDQLNNALTAVRRSGFLDEISHFVGKSVSRAYRHCSSPIGMGVCIAIATTTLQKATQFAVDRYTVLGYRPPTAVDMSVEDLEMAANMFSSSKFNIELSKQEIELLAATSDDYSNRPSGFAVPFARTQASSKNLGFIPILGDSPKSGIVCPIPAVAAEIVRLEEPDGKKFQLLKDAMTKAGMTYLETDKSE